MAEVTAAEVKRLRDATGAGMMDCKKALVENDGDFERAGQWLREKGLSKASERAARQASEGAVGLVVLDGVAAAVELKCETDFVAQNHDFVNLATDLATVVAESGEGAVDQKKDELDTLKITLKENIDVGRVVRVAAGEGHALDTYLHVQGGRGKNAVIVELEGGPKDLAHDLAVHIAFARPRYLSRDEVPPEVVERERATFAAIARNEGKPEQALAKIVEGRLNGFFKERCLLEQSWVKDEKQTIAQLLGGARVVRFEQVEVGA